MKKILLVLVITLAVFAQKSPKINGFFIQPMLGYGIAVDWSNSFNTQQNYDDWIKSMADIGATMLFYQWTAYYETDGSWASNIYGGEGIADFCYYQPNLNEISNIPVNSWMPAIKNWTGSDITPVQRALDAGEKNGVDIWLGLYLCEKGQFNWWEAVGGNDISAKDSATFRYHVERSVDLLRDLVEQYGEHTALGGFYYPIEIANNIVFNNEEHWQILTETLNDVAKAVYDLSGKRLAISPFFNTHTDEGFMSHEKYGEMWDYMLSRLETKNLIVMLQDGVGVEPNTIDKIEPFYSAVSDACKKNDIAFWANSELFKNPSGDRANPVMSPASVDKILQQMAIEKEFADTFVCFSYMALDTIEKVFNPEFPNLSTAGFTQSARTKLYNDYKEYYNSIKDEPEEPSAISAKNMNLKKQNISVSGNKIFIPKFDKPASYSLISPNGKMVLSGVANEAKVINAPNAAGIYILMIKTANQTPIRQKVFLQLQ